MKFLQSFFFANLLLNFDSFFKLYLLFIIPLHRVFLQNFFDFLFLFFPFVNQRVQSFNLLFGFQFCLFSHFQILSDSFFVHSFVHWVLVENWIGWLLIWNHRWIYHILLKLFRTWILQRSIDSLILRWILIILDFNNRW